MSRKVAGAEIERLIQLLARLPGLGPRSDAAEKIVTCTTCGNIDTLSPCTICQDPQRDGTLIIVVEDVGDLWALERSGAAKARYHVLGGHLSPLDGVGPADLNIPRLLERAREPGAVEVLLALNATVDGQSTAHFIAEQLAGTGVRISRLAVGVPVGGELDYLDDGTLATAVRGRHSA
jgi:recombination protein RecR